MMKLNDITICMVHFNRPTLLMKTLPSYKEFNNIFVWDNASISQNKNLLKAFSLKNKNVKVVWHDENVGWPKAINKMVTMADTDWVLITAEDMLLGKDFLDTTRQLLEWKPNLEQIYLHTFDAMLFHKKTFARIGWWEERQNQVHPVAEDDDFYLKLVEHLGYSPYVYPGDHIQGEERERRIKLASTRDLMERMDNISYFSNCRWGISSVNYDIQEITRDKAYINEFCKKEGESGLAFHHRKWNLTNDENDLLSKEGTFWKRALPEKDFFPEFTKLYQEKYF